MNSINLKTTISNDTFVKFLVYFPIIFTIVLVVYLFVFKVMKRGVFFDKLTTYMLVCEVVVIIICISAFYIKLKSLQRIVETGFPAKAKIEQLTYSRGRGTLVYSWIYEGNLQKNTIGVNMTNETENMKVGDEIDIIVDNRNVKHSIIKSLYK